MKIKLSMLFGMLAIASMLLAACGGGGTPTAAPATQAPGTEAPATAAATEAAAPAGTLRIWADDTRALCSRTWQMKSWLPTTSNWLLN